MPHKVTASVRKLGMGGLIRAFPYSVKRPKARGRNCAALTG